MTITTEVRINWPVPAIKLLDHVTRVAGGDPAKVRRNTDVNWCYNRPAQGLRTLAGVTWSERPMSVIEFDDDYRAEYPPALVVLSIDNPYGYGPPENTGRWVQAFEILPKIVEWLDDQGVPRECWWWEDECAGEYYPGTVDVAQLWNGEDLDTWRWRP